MSASASSVPAYAKFELTFNVDNTVATNLQLPYDPAPPPGLAAGIGVSVQGLFLPPGQSNWSQAIVQPGFLFQDYQRQQVSGAEWLYPQGSPVWKIRFAPEVQGAWQYQVQAQDASICSPGVNPCTSWVSSAIGGFTTTAPAPNDHGFVQVSKNDSRYFEFADGKNFVGLGYDSGFGTTDFTYNVDQQYAQWAADGVDFFRVWMSGSTIAGSAWGPWAWFGAPDYGGYLPDPGLWIAPPGSGHDFAFYFDQASGRTCYINGWTQGNVAVKPDTTYQLSVTAQVANVTGPRNPATPGFGFTVKKGAWPSTCPDGIESYTPLVPLMNGTVSTWTTETTTITTGSSQWFLDDLFMVLDNVSSGQAYVSQISLKEILPGGALGPELLVKSTGDQHLDYNLLRSWDWDYALDQAAISGIFLKLVVLEKNDRIWNFINWDGTLSSTGGNDNFYAAPNTKVRALHQYFWRYLAARWGYATGLHSWELLNEGDPYDGNHYNQAEAFGSYMHQNEPSRHLVTTSAWASFPVSQFWGNPAYPDVDYADLHAYISTGLGAYEWDAPSNTTLDTNPADTYQSSAGALSIGAAVTSGTKGISIRGQGNWTISVLLRAQNVVGSCPYGVSSSLAGPQMMIVLDGANTMTIPPYPGNPGNFWNCTAPAGTYPYTTMTGTLTLPDANWHQLNLDFQTTYATSGSAWFDSLMIQSPDGRTARLYGNGTFDDHWRMDYDTAWYTNVYALLDGAKSVSGAGKPVVRGEAGIDYAGGPQTELPQLASDLHGVWLHNYLWGTLNSGGLYELYWWTNNIINNNLYFQYAPVRNFLEGIPLNNGKFVDAQATASSSAVAVVGQKDLADGQAHLWIRNVNHTWWNVVNNVAWGQLSGTVTVGGFTPNQTYPVQWWQFDDPGNLTTTTGTVTADGSGNVVLNLATLAGTTTDVAVKIGAYTGLYSQQIAPVIK